MYEYLIQWLDSEPDLGDDYDKIVRPNSVESKSGMLGLTLAEGQFSFSWEMPGLQVVYVPKDQANPTPHATVTGWVKEICDNIVRASGLPAKVLVDDGEVWSF